MAAAKVGFAAALPATGPSRPSSTRPVSQPVRAMALSPYPAATAAATVVARERSVSAPGPTIGASPRDARSRMRSLTGRSRRSSHGVSGAHGEQFDDLAVLAEAEAHRDATFGPHRFQDSGVVRPCGARGCGGVGLGVVCDTVHRTHGGGTRKPHQPFRPDRIPRVRIHRHTGRAAVLQHSLRATTRRNGMPISVGANRTARARARARRRAAMPGRYHESTNRSALATPSSR